MADPIRFTITLEEPSPEGGVSGTPSEPGQPLELEVGQEVRGVVEVEVLEEVEFREAEVRFTW